MPPRRKAAAAAAAAAAAQPEESAPPPRPAKRARTRGAKAAAAASAQEETEEQQQQEQQEQQQGPAAPEPPAAPEEDAPAPPPPPPPPAEEDGTSSAPPPPPPQQEVAPPPPPEPPAAHSHAPPPPPPPDAQVGQEENEEEEPQGAEYWARMAAEEEKARKAAVTAGKQRDLYLDTINRSLLDFDFEKLCSVTLSHTNVYGCLVCGKYFQGRGTNSHAYFHSIDEGHRVYINLETAKVYILPDNYLVEDPSLSDIQYLLNPTFTPRQIATLDAPNARPSFDLQAQPYHPGFVGLNNIGANDYMNVVIQALAHVKPLRDFLLSEPALALQQAASFVELQQQAGGTSLSSAPSELSRWFSMLVRKMWNPRAFKAQVSPHEFLQEVGVASKGKFRTVQQGDPMEFLSWLVNRLHVDLGGSKKKPSIVSRCFQGEVKIESQQVFVRTGLEEEGDDVDKLDHDGRKEGGQEDEQGRAKFNIDREVKTDRTPFFLLAIDLPPPPVFQDVIESNIIPQVPIAEVLAKYDGLTFQEARGMIRRYKITRLPPYLILHFRRFTKNNFVEERNPTIVNFPIKGLDMKDYSEDPSLAPLAAMYDLVANITHEATAGTVRDNSVWRAQVHTRVDGERIEAASAVKQEDAMDVDTKPANGVAKKGKGKGQGRQKVPSGPPAQTNGGTHDDDDEEEDAGGAGEGASSEERWYQIQDLIVEDVNRQMLFLGESYIQVWERRGGAGDVEAALRQTQAPKLLPKPAGAMHASAAAASSSSGAKGKARA